MTLTPLQAAARGLCEAELDVTAEELCDALWLCQQGIQGSAPAGSAQAAPVPCEWPGSENPDGTSRPQRVPETDLPVAARQHRIFHRGQISQEAGQQAGGDGPEPLPATRIRLPGSPALPHVRALARALRPLRYDTQRWYSADRIDEEETVRRAALGRIRLPAHQTTRRRRLDLDLVIDLGGSGPVWDQLVAELRTMLEIHGAFRSVRTWVLDTDAAAISLRVGHPGRAAERFRTAARYPAGAVCPPPRRPLVVIVTDGTGEAWRTGAMYQPLREWTRYGTVLLIHLLPTEMWNRTALRTVPVTFFPATDGYHRGTQVEVADVDLSIAGVDRMALPGASAIPVIGLDVPWLCSWLPLLRGTGAGAVPGFALLVPPPGLAAAAGGALPARRADRGDLDAAQRAQRFWVTASAEACGLAELLVSVSLTVAAMRKIQHELLPDSRPAVLAEVLLGGLVYQMTPRDADVPGDDVAFEFHPGVRDMLRNAVRLRPGGEAQLARNAERVRQALLSDRGGDVGYAGIQVGAGGDLRVDVLANALPLATAGALVSAGSPADPGSPVGTGPRMTGQPQPTGTPETRPLKIGLWGAPTSGRTTFLAVLGHITWQRSRRGGHWRVAPADQTTKHVMDQHIGELVGHGRFPAASVSSTQLSFQFLYQPPTRRWPLRWLRPTRAAEIGVTLADRPGGEFGEAPAGRPGSELANPTLSRQAEDDLTAADALIYFFDPVYDLNFEGTLHSIDFFTAAEAALLKSATRSDVRDRFLPQHIAVFITKLDDPRVFRIARRHGCVEADPRTGLPWVPDRHAQRLFRALCQEQMTVQADYLLTRLHESFHPARISFHVISSVGFWTADNGRFNPQDFCNVEVTEDGQHIRGGIHPVHVIEPLVNLVECARRKA